MIPLLFIKRWGGGGSNQTVILQYNMNAMRSYTQIFTNETTWNVEAVTCRVGHHAAEDGGDGCALTRGDQEVVMEMSGL